MERAQRVDVGIDVPLDADLDALLAFWREATGYEVVVEGWPEIRSPGEHLPRIWLQPVPEPKVGKARVHLDIYLSRAGAAERQQRLLGLGATIARPAVEGERFIVLADPVGTEFCLCWDD